MFSAATAVIALSWRGVATGQPAKSRSEIDLRWDAPNACDARDRTLARVELLLGRPLDDTTVRMRALARVTPRGVGGWRLLLTLSGSVGGERVRDLGAGSCDEISEAAALILALALDPALRGLSSVSPVRSADTFSPGSEPRSPSSPDAGASSPVTEAQASAPDGGEDSLRQNLGTNRPEQPPIDHSPSPTPTSSSSLESPSPTVRSNASDVGPRPWRYSLGVGPVLVLGAVPAPALGTTVFIAAARKPLRFELSGLYVLERFAHTEERPNVGAYLSLWAGALSACYMPLGTAHMEAGACVRLESGVLRGEGTGVDHPGQAHPLWLSTGISGLWGFFVSKPVALLVEPSLQIPWGRPEFEAAGLHIYRPPILVGALRLLLELRFF